MNLKDFITKQTSNRHFDEFVFLLPDSYKGNFIKFLDDYEVALKEEYASNDTPKYCTIKGVDFLIPASYNGDVDSFLDDISYFQNNENHKYEIHNACNKNNQIEQKDIVLNVTAGDNDSYSLHLLTPLKMAKRQASKEDIELELMKKMVARYMTAYTKTCRLNEDRASEQKEIQDKIDSSKEGETDDKVLGLFNKSEHKLYTLIKSKTSDKKRPISLNQSYFSYCNNEHSKHIAKITAMRLGSALKCSAKQMADVAIGLLGSPFFAAYNLLDKKYHIVEKQLPRILGSIRNFTHTALNDYVRPKIKKALLTTAITSAVVLGGKYSENISQFAEDVKTERQLNKKYKITDEKSFDELFNASFEHIVKSLTLSEVFVADAYSDNGLTVNTVGLGSYYYPCNGNPKSSDWQTVNSYVKKHGNIHIDGQKAVELVYGWFRYRDDGRTYKLIQKALMGAELNVCQFSAIATCCYNSEVSGKKVAKFVSENYNNPYACALMFMSVSPNNEFHNGINKRHLHEALKYLDYEDYNKEMDKLLVEKRTAKNGSTFYVTSITQLTPEDCQKFKQALKENNKEVISQICDKIFDYKGKGNAKTIKIIYNTNNMDNAVSEVTMQNVSKSRTISWDNALSIASNSGKSY